MIKQIDMSRTEYYQPLSWGLLCKECRHWLTISGLAGIIMSALLPWDMRLLAGWFLVLEVVMLSILDWQYGLLYDRLVIPLALTGLISASAGFTLSVVDALSGALLAGIFLWGLRMISKGGLGLGDVKMAMAMGLWLGWRATVAALFMAFLVGGLLACCLLISGNARQKTLPFGPCLALGAYLSFICGEKCWQAYASLL